MLHFYSLSPETPLSRIIEVHLNDDDFTKRDKLYIPIEVTTYRSSTCLTMDYKKLFTFSPAADWTMSHLEQPHPKVKSDKYMMRMKDELNSVKNKLSDYDIAQWGQHTTRMDPASKVVRVVGGTIRPKPFCTNAWCKFYELLSTLRLLERVDKSIALHSLHLCEAPGGFVCALNHFIQSEFRGMQHTWLANTLNPYHEKCKLGVMIADDRLIRHSLDRWLFGEDNTGDLTKPPNIRHIIAEARQHLGYSIQLVTADGSLDCQLKPSEQEMMVYPLVLAEVYTALSLLSPGGVAVFKMFTMFECHTIALMYSLNLLFEEVHIHKPVTSKPGNSEVYVVCKERVPTIGDHVMAIFLSAMDSNLPLATLSQIPETFLQQMRAAAQSFKQRQVETILNNIRCYDNVKLVPSISNDKYAKDYISVMGLQPISAQLSVVTPQQSAYTPYKEEITINCYGTVTSSTHCRQRKRRLSGNFMQRSSNTVEQRLKELVLADEYFIQPTSILYPIETCCTCNHSPIDACTAINPVVVPRLTTDNKRVYNCASCDTSLLADYNVLADSVCDIISQAAAAEDLEAITGLVCASPCSPTVVVNVTSQPDVRIGDEKTNKLLISNSPIDHFQSLLGTIKMLQTGDYLLVHSVNCLFRLGAGVVYLLWHCFDEVAIAGHNPTNHLPSILFKHCIMSHSEKIRCVELLEQLVSSLAADWTVLTLVPAPAIINCKELHNSFICQVNNESLKRAINYLVSKRNPAVKT